MIRIVALGLVLMAGLAAIAATLGVVWLAPGLGALAAAAKKSTLPSPKMAVPILVGIEGDRLPIRISEDTLTNSDKLDIVYVTTEPDRFTHAQFGPLEIASSPSLDMISRQWRNPYDPSASAEKEKSKQRSTDTPQDRLLMTQSVVLASWRR